MSNMFLHSSQVIDSKLQRASVATIILWNQGAISDITFLNKWVLSGSFWIEIGGKFAPLPLNPSVDFYF
jgi:hypothetical protein